MFSREALVFEVVALLEVATLPPKGKAGDISYFEFRFRRFIAIIILVLISIFRVRVVLVLIH